MNKNETIEYTIQLNEFGRSIQWKNIFCFFGNKKMSISHLSQVYPNHEWHFLKQVHSNQIIESQIERIEADGHYTHKAHVGLVITTADCLPIFFCSDHSSFIGALHAGWRGVEQGIISLMIKKILKSGIKTDEIKVFIGPHIHLKNFEVDKVVMLRMVESAKRFNLTDRNKILENSIHKDKYLINLTQFSKEEVVFWKIPVQNIYIAPENTYENSAEFFSFRKNPGEMGRQLSFITRFA